MEVTVYIEEEKTDLISEPEEWQAKVKELGLAGQEELFSEDTKANPFLRMDAGLVRVFEALCPTKVEIEKFNVEPIPMKALSAYGLAKLECYFGKVEIWYAPGQPDPVMVGTSGNERFLMAQWGPEKHSIGELRVIARERWITHAKATIASTLATARAQLEDIEGLADRYFDGQWVSIY